MNLMMESPLLWFDEGKPDPFQAGTALTVFDLIPFLAFLRYS